MHGPLDCYLVLGLDTRATDSEITRAYRSLIRRHHPDTRPVLASPSAAARDHERLAEIMEAYKILSDPARKASYDQANGPLTVPSHPVPVRYRAARDMPRADKPITISPVRWTPTTRRCS